MKCIILCASHDETPKSLTIIDENLTSLDVLINQALLINEIDKVYVVTNGESYSHFDKWYKNIDNEKVILINDNTTSPKAKLGAIGDIKYTLNMENIDDDLMILAGDAIYDFEFKDMYEYYKNKNTAVVAVKKINTALDLNQYGTISFDKDNKVTDMHEKVKDAIGNYIALALYFYPRTVIRMLETYLQEGNRRTSPGYFLEYLYKNMDTYAYEVEGDYYSLK